MIAKMRKVEIIGPRRYLNSALHLFQDMGELHIEEVPLGESEGRFLLHRIQIDETLEKEKELLENLLNLTEEAFRLGSAGTGEDDSTLRSESTEWEVCYESSLHDLYFRLARLNNTLKSLVRRKLNIEDDLSVAKRYDKLVAHFLPVIADLDEETPYEYLGISMPTKEKNALVHLKIQLEQIVGAEYRFFSHDFEDGQTAALLAFDERYAGEVKDLLWHEGISELRGPSEFEGMPLDETLKALHQKLIDLPTDLEDIHQKIETRISDNRAFILAVRERCLNRLEHFAVYPKVALTKYTFIMNAWIPSRSAEVNAWVPSKSIEQLRKLLDRKFDGAILVNELDVDGVENEDIPVKLDNIAAVRPFELLLKFFPPPKYGTVDPTSLIALFFPLLFGMILGDIAYGLVVGLIGLILRYRSTAETLLRRASSIFLIASLWTIVFGILYGEFLGDLGGSLGLHPLHPIFHREKAIIPSFIMALSIGAAHIVLGYAVGIINSLREKNTHTVLEKSAEVGGLFGLFFMIGSFAKLLSPVLFASGAGLLVISMIVMIYLHNFLAPLEIVKAVGNILSYARIMAIGLSSVILAIVANKFSGMVGNIIVGIIIAGLLHALNIALGIFSPTIHAARLHYVEFFTKFYKAEGKHYLPFKRKGGDLI